MDMPLPAFEPPETEPELNSKLIGCPFIERVCHTCRESESTTRQLQYCSRCKSPVILYCSRECQVADYEEHKKICSLNNAVVAFNGPPIIKESLSNPQIPINNGSLEVYIPKPFHTLRAKKWLHYRPQKDVFTLLVDVYRLRMEDAYRSEGVLDRDGIYGEGTDGIAGFKRFLSLLELKPDLLPAWWSSTSAMECVAFSSCHCDSQGVVQWSGLVYAAGWTNIVQHYRDFSMPSQLRVFAEQVYGSGYGDALNVDVWLEALVVSEKDRQ